MRLLCRQIKYASVGTEVCRGHLILIHALKDFLRNNGMLEKCIRRYGKLRIPISVAREILGLSENTPVPIVKKSRKKRRKTHLTMKDIKKIRSGGVVFDYRPKN